VKTSLGGRYAEVHVCALFCGDVAIWGGEWRWVGILIGFGGLG
jgi:hypothetical protein